jgi:hypothetical protein
MQVNIYVKDSDYDTLAKHKPADSKTTSAFMTDILRKRAEFLRSTETPEGTPIVQQYERQ